MHSQRQCAQECKASASFISIVHTHRNFVPSLPLCSSRLLAIIGQGCVRRMPLNYCSAAKCHLHRVNVSKARRHSLATDTEASNGNDARATAQPSLQTSRSYSRRRRKRHLRRSAQNSTLERTNLDQSVHAAKQSRK